MNSYIQIKFSFMKFKMRTWTFLLLKTVYLENVFKSSPQATFRSFWQLWQINNSKISTDKNFQYYFLFGGGEETNISKMNEFHDVNILTLANFGCPEISNLLLIIKL